MMKLSRLDIVLVDLNPTRGSEIQKTRPCVIVSPDIINHNSRTVIVCAITHYDEQKAKSFFFVPVEADQTTGLSKKSLINTQQIRTIDKVRIREKFDKLHKNLETSLGYAITLATGTDKVVNKL